MLGHGSIERRSCGTKNPLPRSHASISIAAFEKCSSLFTAPRTACVADRAAHAGVEKSPNMNTADLIAKVQAVVGLPKSVVAKTIKAAVEQIQKGLSKGDSVHIAGLGTFLVRRRAARQGVNPKTREPIAIGARKVVRFRAGSQLVSALNGG